MGRHLRATSCVQVEARCELRFKKYHLKTRRCRAQPISACAFLPTSNDAHSARGLGHPAGAMLGSETPLGFSCGPSGSVPEGCLGKQNGPFVPCEAEHGPEPAPPHCAGAGALGIWAGRGARTGPGLATRVDSHLLGASPQRHYVPPGARPGAGVWAPARSLPRTLAQTAGPGRQGPAQLRGLRLASSLVAGSRLGCGLTPHIRGPPFITARGQVHLWQEQHREHEEMHLAS